MHKFTLLMLIFHHLMALINISWSYPIKPIFSDYGWYEFIYNAPQDEGYFYTNIDKDSILTISSCDNLDNDQITIQIDNDPSPLFLKEQDNKNNQISHNEIITDKGDIDNSDNFNPIDSTINIKKCHGNSKYFNITKILKPGIHTISIIINDIDDSHVSNDNLIMGIRIDSWCENKGKKCCKINNNCKMEIIY